MPNAGLKTTKILRQCTVGDKAEITLWCEGPSSEELTSRRGRKRKADDSGNSGSSKWSARKNLIDQIVQILRKKHGEDYNAPQYRMWARMKHNRQYPSLDEAPTHFSMRNHQLNVNLH